MEAESGLHLSDWWCLGNLVDRLMHGFVVDFIDFFWGKSHYPAFNIADSAICIGAVLIIWDAFLSGKSEQDTTEGVKK